MAAFLTYPQCDVCPEALGIHLDTLRPTVYTLVAKELHKDGNAHLHAFVIFATKLNTKDIRFFDFEDHHPNIVSPRNRQKTVDYIKKCDPTGKDLYETGTFDDGKRGGCTRAAWQAALDATTAEETMELVAAASPRDFIINYDRVESYANKKHKAVPKYQSDPENVFVLPEDLERWKSTEFVKDVSQMLVPPIYSAPRPTGLGLVINNRQAYIRTDRKHCSL